MANKQPGLDGRHRDKNGEIHQKMGNTLVGTIRKSNPDFAPGRRSDMRLDTLLEETGSRSLTEYRLASLQIAEPFLTSLSSRLTEGKCRARNLVKKTVRDDPTGVPICPYRKFPDLSLFRAEFPCYCALVKTAMHA
jgi:hypothetical protein